MKNSTTITRETTATEAFISRMNEAREALAKVQSLLADNLGVAPEAIHWGHVGDAAHIAEKLQEIAEFISYYNH